MRRAWRVACESHIHSSHSINLFHFFFRPLDVVFVCLILGVESLNKECKIKTRRNKRKQKVHPASSHPVSKPASLPSFIHKHTHTYTVYTISYRNVYECGSTLTSSMSHSVQLNRFTVCIYFILDPIFDVVAGVVAFPCAI